MPPRTASAARRPPPSTRPTATVAPGGTVTGSLAGTGAPSTVTAIAAPTRAITAPSGNRSTGPLVVSSSAAASARLPTTRLARRCDRSSMGPLGGTPTCQYPVRPGTSCTVVNGPPSSTSIVAGAVSTSLAAPSTPPTGTSAPLATACAGTSTAVTARRTRTR